ncbi:hypothetical protein GQ651_12955 [Alphaproteobacteria bacterium GH1-50]|uniref:Transferrin-binding protein B C-lobe/N-lobe beta barrel domain-containing protein n=1 Tax=Kangsaoukella pontilimi TaxID=2691042 RepID=A0A7C9NFD0_9RHOB|nr:hypothetical protein [Kangsaoukella pontilimi]MXQ08759.1 hypothetical protein [Kangsaoukella pontilimi]
MSIRTAFCACIGAAALQACGAVVEEAPSAPPPDPEPFRTSSQLSIFGLNDSFGDGLGVGSSLAILRTSGGKSIHDTLSNFHFSEIYITAGGYNTTSESQIDRMRIRAGTFAKPPFDYNPSINFTLGDRIDEEGGPTDIFEAELNDLYTTPAPARVIIFNTDHDANADLDFAAIIFWDIDFDGWGSFEPFEMIGTTTLANREYLEMRTVGSGIVTFNGEMRGIYRSGFSPEEIVSGIASLDVDFSSKTMSGDIVDVSTATYSLQDIVLAETDPLAPSWSEPYSGAAYTADYDPNTGVASMQGRYDGLLYQDLGGDPLTTESNYLTGNVTLTGAGGDLVGGIVARR